MSHEIVKNISFNCRKKEIWITSHSNNVHPRIPKKWHCESLSKIYKSAGIEVIEREILKEFYNGNFQGNSTFFGKITPGRRSIDSPDWLGSVNKIRNTDLAR